MATAVKAQGEPLVEYSSLSEIQAGAKQAVTSWPSINALPVPQRGSVLHCTWVLCFVPLGLITYALGFVVAVVLAVLALLAYACLGCCACTAASWFGTWDWAGGAYLKVLYLTYQYQLMSREGRPGCGPKDMPIAGLQPVPPGGELRKWSINYAMTIMVPTGSEEEFEARQLTVAALMERNLAKLPLTEEYTTFADDEDPVKYVMDRLASVYPVLYQTWPDKKSDEALTRFCLHGIGAHRVETETIHGKKFFVVRANVLANLPVREGYERYGGDAYFDEHWRAAFIKDAGLAPQRPDGTASPVTIYPSDAEWPRAKFRFRSSYSVLVTFADHLFGIHLEVSNLMVTAIRENLEPDHPMRRFLVPYSYKAIAVNDNAHFNLVQPGSFMSRCFAFTDNAMQIAFAHAQELLRGGLEKETVAHGGPFINHEKYFEYLRDVRGIDTAYTRHGAKYWRITENFVKTYVEAYYESAVDMIQDVPLVQTMLQLSYQSTTVDYPSVVGDALAKEIKTAVEKGQVGIMSVLEDRNSAQAYADVFKTKVIDMLTLYIWQVTAFHEQVGAIGSYVQDVSFCAFKWVHGASVGTKQTALAQALLMSFTSMPMPTLLGADWTHLFPERRGGAIPGRAAPDEAFRAYQSGLRAFSQEIDDYNVDAARRPFPNNQPLYVFNPKLLETAVNV